MAYLLALETSSTLCSVALLMGAGGGGIGGGGIEKSHSSHITVLIDSLLHHDTYMLLADFDAYLKAQSLADAAFADPERWTRMSILNVARCGYFSSDRSVREYAERIWKL